MTLAAHALDFGYPGRVIGRGLDLALARRRGAVRARPERRRQDHALPHAARPAARARRARERRTGATSRTLARARDRPRGRLRAAGLVELLRFQRSRRWWRWGAPRTSGPSRGPAQRDREIARAALERMGIAALADRPVSAVSGGERQLALIARALATEATRHRHGRAHRQPRLRQPGARARARSRACAHAGIAVLLCTHDPDHALPGRRPRVAPAERPDPRCRTRARRAHRRQPLEPLRPRGRGE